MDTKKRITDILKQIIKANISENCTQMYFDFSLDENYVSKNKDYHILSKNSVENYNKPVNDISKLVKMSYNLPNPDLTDSVEDSADKISSDEHSADKISELISKNFQLPRTFDVKDGIKELLDENK